MQYSLLLESDLWSLISSISRIAIVSFSDAAEVSVPLTHKIKPIWDFLKDSSLDPQVFLLSRIHSSTLLS